MRPSQEAPSESASPRWMEYVRLSYYIMYSHEKPNETQTPHKLMNDGRQVGHVRQAAGQVDMARSKLNILGWDMDMQLPCDPQCIPTYT